jgi:protein-L-isoaspartate(D-aspartate) O-methyltransferase
MAEHPRHPNQGFADQSRRNSGVRIIPINYATIEVKDNQLGFVEQDHQTESDALIAQLEEAGHLTDPRLEEAMQSVPRHVFVPEEVRQHAYQDRPLPVGLGQTISAPHMVALMTSALQLAPHHRVLEIGTGLGYHAAVLSRMVPDGEVISIEFVPELAKKAVTNLAEAKAPVRVLQRDGATGAGEFAPFDAIIINCAVPEIPATIIAQLAEGGRIIAPVGVTQCELRLAKKNNGELHYDDLGECLFVNAQGKLGGDDGVLRPAP